MTIKLCIVTEFNQANFFQWTVALKKYEKELDIELSSVLANFAARRVCKPYKEHQQWKDLREADAVFVYVTRCPTMHHGEDVSNDWWKLPFFVKSLMRPDAKMIVQYDDEFMWVFNPHHVWWKMANPENYGPDQFFKETGILEVPDAHFVVTNHPFYKSYTTKPVFKMLLPQLCRYKLDKYTLDHKQHNIALMVHSIFTSSISKTLENVIRKQNYPASIFTGNLEVEWKKEQLPVNSEVFPRVDYEAYMDLLWQYAFIGLDDNEGYYGWSRFTMECAIAWIPCVGSSEAVQDIFPELYTATQDYIKQIELIEKLKIDKKFYKEIVESGRKRVLESLSDFTLCKKMMEIFDQLGAPKTGKITIKEALKPERRPQHP